MQRLRETCRVEFPFVILNEYSSEINHIKLYFHNIESLETFRTHVAMDKNIMSCDLLYFFNAKDTLDQIQFENYEQFTRIDSSQIGSVSYKRSDKSFNHVTKIGTENFEMHLNTITDKKAIISGYFIDTRILINELTNLLDSDQYDTIFLWGTFRIGEFDRLDLMGRIENLQFKECIGQFNSSNDSNQKQDLCFVYSKNNHTFQFGYYESYYTHHKPMYLIIDANQM
jgi:hypothetical protein